MRFSHRITLVKETESRYDPEKGEYIEGTPIKTTLPCNLSKLSVERTNEFFGQIDKAVVVARLQRPFKGEIDYILIDGQRFNLLRRSDYRKGVLYLERIK